MSKPSDAHGTEKTARKRRAQNRGRWAELVARLYLMLTGHRILAANFRTPVGEVDLIAKKGPRISFVEVKARDDLSDAAHAVTARQRGRIQRAAEYFLMQNPAYQACDIRFDVALVRGVLTLDYVADAWRP